MTHMNDHKPGHRDRHLASFAAAIRAGRLLHNLMYAYAGYSLMRLFSIT